MSSGVWEGERSEPEKDRYSFSNLPVQARMFLKLVAIALVLLPAILVLDRIYLMVKERENYYHQTAQEIAHLWGKEQVIKGPVLSVPFQSKDGRRSYVHILPEKLRIEGDLDPEIRQRGIFEAVVYRTELSVNGHFSLKRIQDSLAKINASQVFYEQSFVGIGISDTHSLNGSSGFSVDGKQRELRANSGASGLLGNGIHVDYSLSPERSNDEISFKEKLKLNGAQSLKIAAVGAQTDVLLKAPWKDPTFVGRHLPVAKEVSEQGFTAHWDISHLGQTFGRVVLPGQNTVVKDKLIASSFGVKLHQPVSPYRLVVRAIKYGLLFLVVTFGFYFLSEMTTRHPVHLVQYLVLSAPLCLFFLLLLSMAEHFGFVPAYLAGSAIVITMASAYTLSVLASKKKAILSAVSLAGLYAALFFMLKEQDYSLLFGTFTLVALTAVFMWATKDLTWMSSKVQE